MHSPSVFGIPVIFMSSCFVSSILQQDHFRSVLDDFQVNEMVITNFIADNPKRLFVRNSLCHSSRYACEYCEAHGICTVKESVKTCPKKQLQNQIKEITTQIENLQTQPCSSIALPDIEEKLQL